jgi:ABC-2 type transport system permease protein
LLDFGYASLAGYFSLAPWLLLFLVPTITMRSFADEFKLGSFEILKTLPLSPTDLVMGKWLGSFLIVLTNHRKTKQK